MVKDKKNKSIFGNLRYKYRLVVINDDTFEQKTSIRLSKFNLYLGIGSVLLLVVFLVTSLIAFTNLKYYLPGVGTLDFRHKINQLALQSDSLSQELNQRNLWIKNFQNIVSGDLDSTYYINEDSSLNSLSIDSIDLYHIDEKDEKLRREVEASIEEDQLAAKIMNVENVVSGVTFAQSILTLKLQKPLDGIVIKEFSIANEHLGVDIAADKDEPVKAIYEGVVFLSEWNPKTGYVIGIQHPNNLISFYKHNSLLLKKIGTFVKKGESVAIIGKSGEQSTGPHLHFEMWHNGKVQNPLEFLNLTKLN